ncbi:MAG: hypothetical protein SNJ71_06120, partial [Bacteroidales bacterium]
MKRLIFFSIILFVYYNSLAQANPVFSREPLYITKQIEQTGDTLWILYDDGENYNIELKNKEFELIRKIDYKTELYNGIPNKIYKDAQNNIWIELDNGIAVFDAGKWKHFSKENNNLAGNKINCFKSKDNIVWLGTDNGATKYINNEFVLTLPGDSVFGYKSITSIEIQNDTTTWFGMNNYYDGGYAKHTPDTLIMYKNSGNLNYVIDLKIFPANSDTLWVFTDGGGIIKVLTL